MNIARSGQIQRTLMNREGIVKVSENYGIFILTAVQRSPGDPVPTVGTTVHYYVDDDILCRSNGVTIYHIKRVWLRTKPAEFLRVPQRPYVGLELARIFKGNIDASIDVIEQPVNDLIEGKICGILNDNEAVINIFDAHYAWLHIGNVKNNVVQWKIGGKIFFLEDRLWISNSRASSWAVATCAWMTKASVYYTDYQAKNLHNCRNPSDLAKALRAANIKSNNDASEGARMFAKALQDFEATLTSHLSSEKTSILDSVTNKNNGVNLTLGSHSETAVPEASSTNDVNLVPTSSNNTLNFSSSSSIPRIINNSSREIIKKISATQGALITKNCIIWMESSHFHGTPNGSDYYNVHYSAELVWEPKTISYGYRLYQAQAVWFAGCPKPNLFRNINVTNCSHSDISRQIDRALTNKILPKVTKKSVDESFKKICESILLLKAPWEYWKSLASTQKTADSIKECVQKSNLTKTAYLSDKNLDGNATSSSSMSQVTSTYPTIFGSSCQTIKEINSDEGFFITGNCIVWVHSAHFYGRPKSSKQILYEAELLWQPKTSYQHRLYQTRAVWFAGDAKPEQSSTVNIRNCHPSYISGMIRTALYSADIPVEQCDGVMRYICEVHLLPITKPWTFYENFFMTDADKLIESLLTPVNEEIPQSSTIPTYRDALLLAPTPKALNVLNSTAQNQSTSVPDKTRQILRFTKHIEGNCSRKLIRAITPTEGVLVHGEAIIWMHSSHFHGRIHRGLPQIHFTAELLWQPAVITYKYALYQTEAVWFSGNPKPNDLSSVSIRSWTGSEVSELINSALVNSSLESNQIITDQTFRKLCKLLQKFKEPWNFNFPKSQLSLPAKSVTLPKIAAASASVPAPINQLPTLTAAETSTSHNSSESSEGKVNPDFNKCPIQTNYSTAIGDDTDTNTSDFDYNFGDERISENDSDGDDLDSDSDGEETYKETQLVATVLSKLIAKRLRSDWSKLQERSEKNVDDEDQSKVKLEHVLECGSSDNEDTGENNSVSAEMRKRSAAPYENVGIHLENVKNYESTNLTSKNGKAFTEKFIEPDSKSQDDVEELQHQDREEIDSRSMDNKVILEKSRIIDIEETNDHEVKSPDTESILTKFKDDYLKSKANEYLPINKNDETSEEIEERTFTIENEYFPKEMVEYINILQNENAELSQRMSVQVVDGHLLYEKVMNSAGVTFEVENSEASQTPLTNRNSSMSANLSSEQKSLPADQVRCRSQGTTKKDKCAIS